jgi:hypothetical protein
MELLEVIDSALQKYDLLTVLLVGGLYMWFRKKLELVHKDVRTVDSAVNNRPNEMKHVKDDVTTLKTDLTKSRIYNMERFGLIETTVEEVKKEVCTKKRARNK